jgi:hypothetical protein
MLEETGFFDQFLAGCIAFAGVCAAIDWLTSPERKAKTRQSIGDWWTYLQYHPVDSIISRAIKTLVEKIKTILGGRLFSFRAFFTYFLISATVSVSYYTFRHRAGDVNFSCAIPSVLIENALPLVAGYYTFWVAMTACFYIADGQNRLLRNLAIFFGTFALWAILVPFVLQDDFTLPFAAASPFRFTSRVAPHLFHCIVDNNHDLAQAGRYLLKSLYMGAFVSYVPLMLISPCILFAKAARPIMQLVLEVVLARIYETPKGVLTQVGIGVGAIAKAIQWLLKSPILH